MVPEDEQPGSIDPFAELSEEGRLVTDKRAVVLAANRAALRSLERQREFVVGKSLVGLLARDARRPFRKLLKQLSAGAKLRKESWAFELPGNRVATLRLSAVLEAENFHWLLQRSEEEAARKRRPLEIELVRAIDALDDAIFVVGSDLKLHYANAAARALLGRGMRRGRALSSPWREFDLVEFVRSLFEESASRREREVRLSGRTLLVRGRCWPQHEFANVTLIDHSTRVRRQEQREREFLAMAAHDLRTPLAGIANAAELLRRSDVLDSESARNRFLDHIEHECARASSSAAALLAMARFESGDETPRLETLPLREIVWEVSSRIRVVDQKGSVTVTVPSSLRVFTNRELLEHALQNLIENALKHGREDVAVTARKSQGQVVIEVSDHGPGMAPEFLERVFRPFHRRPGLRAGAGLGMAIAERSALALGGRLEISSTLGVGTTARLRLPSGILRGEG
jgi:signal transduction histidine kinase